MSVIIGDKVENKLKELFESANKIVILGIGDNTVGDDGFGPYVSTYFIENQIDIENVLFINGKKVPEERQDEIEKFNPDLLLILDTCDSGKEKGTIILTSEKNFANYIPVSTHTLPLQMFVTLLSQNLSGLKVYLLGVHPYKLATQLEREYYRKDKYTLDDYDNNPDLPFYDFNMTDEMIETSNKIIHMLKKLLNI